MLRYLSIIALVVVYAGLLPSGRGISGESDGLENTLADLRITRGKRDIAAVWFADPVGRYRHFVLGADYEAASLVLRTRGGIILKLTLPQSSVFEDREPRLADLDGDGRDEIIVIRSYLNGGAALAIYGVRGSKIIHIAETPDMGHPFGWLNPAGIADFDGDGTKEILFVRKPHVLGRLEMWRLEAGKLSRVMSAMDTSNHIGGTKQIRLWAIADFNGDGVSDLAIPSFDRRAIRFLSFTKGGVREISRKKLPARAKGDFKLVRKNDGRFAVVVSLAGGRSVTVRP